MTKQFKTCETGKKLIAAWIEAAETACECPVDAIQIANTTFEAWKQHEKQCPVCGVRGDND